VYRRGILRSMLSLKTDKMSGQAQFVDLVFLPQTLVASSVVYLRNTVRSWSQFRASFPLDPPLTTD
jgi:hypothetical protein